MRMDVSFPNREPQSCWPRASPDERFRAGAVLLPILLVGGSHAMQVEREGRIPIAQAVGFADARILRRVVAIGCRARDGDDLGQAELRAFGVQAAVGLPDVVVEGDGVAELRVEVARGPLIERHAVLRTKRSHDRIGDFAAAVADAVGEVGEHRFGGQAEGFRRGRGPFGQSIGNHGRVGFERKGVWQRADFDSKVFQCYRAATVRERFPRDQNRINLPDLPHFRLQSH